MKFNHKLIIKIALAAVAAVALIFVVVWFTRRPTDASAADVKKDVREIKDTLRVMGENVADVHEKAEVILRVNEELRRLLEKDSLAALELRAEFDNEARRTRRKLEEMKADFEADEKRRLEVKRNSTKFKPLLIPSHK